MPSAHVQKIDAIKASQELLSNIPESETIADRQAEIDLKYANLIERAQDRHSKLEGGWLAFLYPIMYCFKLLFLLFDQEDFDFDLVLHKIFEFCEHFKFYMCRCRCSRGENSLWENKNLIRQILK